MKKIIVSFLVILAFCGCAWGADAPMGETLEVQPGLFLTLNSARWTEQGNIRPKNGWYLIFDCTFENKSDKPINVSSLMNLFAQDADGFKYDLSIGAQIKGSLDGAVRNGGRLRGEVAFDVSADALIEFFGFSPIMGRQESLWRVDMSVNSVTPSPESTVEDNKQILESVITNLGIDTNSEAYKGYVSTVNKILETHGDDAAALGLLLIDDYKTYIEDGEAAIDWGMIK